MITFKRDVCKDFYNATQYEWLETNGLGGYASSTINGANTRRYHGLLVAASKPPSGRVVLLSKVEETIIVDGEKYELSCSQYPNAIHPMGHHYLKEFRLMPYPKFIYEVKGVTIEKAIAMVHGSNTTIISYTIFSESEEIDFFVRPLINFRDYHHLTTTEESLRCQRDVYEGAVKLTPHSGLPSLYLYHNASAFKESNYYYKDCEYQEEAVRGFDCHEMLFNPGSFVYNIEDGDNCVLVASTESYDEIDTMDLLQTEISRRSKVLRSSKLGKPALDPLLVAADSFLVAGSKENTRMVIAGYHWFGPWVRDTLISLPGLTLTQERPEEAKSILTTMAMYCSEGMLPNRFSEEKNEPEYTSVDSALWFFYAVDKFLDATGDITFVERELLGTLLNIIHYYVHGTRFAIHMDEDGLITFDSPEIPLTWTDVRISGKPLIRRNGKVVEINALWFNAIKVMEKITGQLKMKDEQRYYLGLCEKVRESFNNVFWNPRTKYLFDSVDGESRDESVRANAVFAISLPNELLAKPKQKAVLKVMEEELLTTYGLRTLSPRDPSYIGTYRGGVIARDAAYHQGTVWAWLIGPAISAFLNVNGATAANKKKMEKLLEPLFEHLKQAGLGTVSEIFDGDLPHHPRGCISQAWSVAELLRVCVEEIWAERDNKRDDVVPHISKRF